MRITIRSMDELTPAEWDALNALAATVYPPSDDDTGWPLRGIRWARLEWNVMILEDDGRLSSRVGMLARAAMLNGAPARIGGIGGIMTHPSARRRGYASEALRQAAAFLTEEMRVDFVLLVCPPNFIPFYERLGWSRFEGRLLVEDRGALVRLNDGAPMVYPGATTPPREGVVDLYGPVW